MNLNGRVLENFLPDLNQELGEKYRYPFDKKQSRPLPRKQSALSSQHSARRVHRGKWLNADCRVLSASTSHASNSAKAFSH
jgi:hypothetical protein